MARPKGSKNKKQSKGLGDTIAKVTKATGIDKVVKAVAGNDCGCEARKKALNKLVPYRLKVQNCLTDKQIQWYKDYKGRKSLIVSNDDIVMIESTYSHLFNFSKYHICRSCGGSGKEIIKILDIIDKIYSESNNNREIE